MTDVQRLAIGIIGCGQIARKHIDRYKQIPGVDIVAVADVDRAARDAGQELAVAQHAFADFRDLLAVEEIQAVDVCLHNNYHAPVTLEAFAAGKDVYCEKPIAGSYADGLAMVKGAAKEGRKLAIQLSSLFSAETKVAKSIIDAGTLGRMYYAKSVGFRRRGRCFVDGYGSKSFVQKRVAAGGALYDMGVYHIAQMLYLLGNPEPKTISGATFQEVDMYEDRRKASKYGVEEFGTGWVRLAGDLTLTVEESWAIHLGSLGRPCIAGSQAGLTFDPLTLHHTVADVELDSAVQTSLADGRWRLVDDGTYAGYESPQHHWVATLRGDCEPIDTAGIALNTMLISEGIYLSNKLKREVTPADVRKQSQSTAVKI